MSDFHHICFSILIFFWKNEHRNTKKYWKYLSFQTSRMGWNLLKTWVWGVRSSYMFFGSHFSEKIQSSSFMYIFSSQFFLSDWKNYLFIKPRKRYFFVWVQVFIVYMLPPECVKKWNFIVRHLLYMFCVSNFFLRKLRTNRREKNEKTLVVEQ